MEQVLSLIDKASKKCGGDSALARELGVNKSMVSLMRSGKAALPVELAVLMAPMAGITWEEAARVAMLASAKDDKRAAQLERVFFCKTLAGVVGMLLACVVALGPDGAMAGTKLPKVVTDPHILEYLDPSEAR
ncbi:helix-turn-helix domain-containing protein [Schlegelella sp. S2-27]|uniref:Helix-turn-helix domain-containing protein n=1 Tax=Caldimonas mangrovi TaxID=2944811 RepID=A0ABT0YT32_9BURK|nr:helix-turn-helix domain-containing protein [Caldimonas mangrovi]MCM5681907.1 helix-turn-helix domain-containing protein [Caldimonas mangrovi]